VRRSICVWLGFVVVFVLTMFPPWMRVWKLGVNGGTQQVKLWHAPEWYAPVQKTSYSYPAIDYRAMLVEIATGECFVLALYLTWGRTRKEG